MNVNNVELVAVTAKKSQYPEESFPEIAFVGKSNVGKSSLINCMVNRKSLARTSSSPGKTRTINFYLVENTLYFVDLPGYGYAKAPKTEIAKWGNMIEQYLLKRETLKAIILLIDIRHDPSANDLLMYDWIKHYGYKIIIVATKSDKIKKTQLKKHTANIISKLNLPQDATIIPFSSEKKIGKEELWTTIQNIIN